MASHADIESQQNLLVPDEPLPQPPATPKPSAMSRLSIPIDALTSRMNLGGRFEGLRTQSITSRFTNLRPAVFVMLSIYSLLTNLMLLFVILLVVGGMFGIGKLQGNDLEIGSWRATTSQLYTTLLVIAIPLGFWASPFSTVLWLIGASGVTILGHAAFMDKPIESAFSEEAV
jgi:hypothetical protein